MTTFLKQSTAIDVSLGPFLDETDGKTAETGLTITQPDIRLKKNGGAWAQKNAAQTLSHEEAGWYEIALDTTDTNTLGILLIAIHEAGALPVWREFMVIPANAYDALVSGSGVGMRSDVQGWLGTAPATPTVNGVPEVDVTHIGGDAQSATDLKDFADAGYDPSTNKVQGVVLTDTVTTYTGNTPQTGDSFARLGAPAGASVSADIAAIEAQTDDIGAAGAGLTAVPWNSAWDAEVQSEVQDALEANHLDHLLAATYDPASKPGAADALLNELVESDAGVARFTTNALEQAPTGGGAADGSGFTAIPWNAAWDAEVQSEVADALAVYDPPTHAELTAEIDAVQTDVAAVQTTADAILVDTGTTLDGKLDTIDANVDLVLEDTGTTLPATLDTIDNFVDTEVAAIKAKTDQLTFTVANRVDVQVLGMQTGTLDANAAASDFFDEIWDEADAGHTSADTYGNTLRLIKKGAQGLVPFTVGAGSTTTAIATNLTEATNDHYNGRTIVFLSGVCTGQAATIADYTGATKVITVAALTDAPAENDLAVIA